VKRKGKNRAKALKEGAVSPHHRPKAKRIPQREGTEKVKGKAARAVGEKEREKKANRKVAG